MLKYLFIIGLIGLIDLVHADEVKYACRDLVQKHKFDKVQGYPKGREGFVVDHICPLMWGGKDEPSNMQYQTIEEGHIKDKIESTEEGKKLYCNGSNSYSERKVYNCYNNETALEAKDRVENKVEKDE
jgi:hypothetical protein